MATEAGNQFGEFTPIAERQLAQLCVAAYDHVKVAKQAYNQGVFDYDDMRNAAQRCLRMRRMYEKATGKKVRSNPESKAQVAALLR